MSLDPGSAASLWAPSVPVWQLVVRATVVYLSILGLLRVGGKREVGQMGSGEFVAILLISNAVQNAMNGGDASILGGLVLSGTLIAWSVALAYAAFRSKRLEVLIQGGPTLLIHDGRIQVSGLKRERLNERGLRTLLRRQGVANLDEVHEAVLESNGSVSVIRKSEMQRRREGGSTERGPSPSGRSDPAASSGGG